MHVLPDIIETSLYSTWKTYVHENGDYFEVWDVLISVWLLASEYMKLLTALGTFD